MKTYSFITAFAEHYGLKEGIILTELCRKTHLSGIPAILFSVPECRRQLHFLTEKQIRRAIKNLQEQQCICVCQNSIKGFNRTLSYTVADDIYKIYLEAISAVQVLYGQIAIGGG